MYIFDLPIPVIHCGPAHHIFGGTVNQTGTRFNDKAEYRCNEGYALVGDHVTTCEATGQWGPAPSCQSK